MNTPTIEVLGISNEQVMSNIASLKEWYGNYKGKKEVVIIADDKKGNIKHIASTTLDNLEKSVQDGRIEKLRSECEYILRKGHRRVEPVRAEKLPGRNEPCPCGSGKKFKKCCIE